MCCDGLVFCTVVRTRSLSLYTTYHTLGYPLTVPVICSIVIRFPQIYRITSPCTLPRAGDRTCSPHGKVCTWHYTTRIYFMVEQVVNANSHSNSCCPSLPVWPIRPMGLAEQEPVAETMMHSLQLIATDHTHHGSQSRSEGSR